MANRYIYGLLGILSVIVRVVAADQPQWGEAWSRNMVSAERGLPESFDPATGRNVRWAVQLGSETHATPVVAGGRVYIGTNNAEPRDAKHQGDRGVLMCLDARDGRLLWQWVVPKREEDPYHDWPNSGMSSSATVEGDRVYMVNNRGEVACLDVRGLADGNQGPFREEGAHMTPRGTNAPPVPLQPGPLDADVLWLVDLTREAGIWSHDAAHTSILIHGPHLYLNTGTGVDNTHRRIRTPDAPSLLVLDKRTGRILARESEGNAGRIFHCTWSSPSLGRVGGAHRLFFAGGDGVIYAYRPLKAGVSGEREEGMRTLERIWRFDFDPEAPKDEVHRYNSNRTEGPSNIYGMPVFHAGRVYVAGGGDLFWGKNQAWLKCIDASLEGDITERGLLWSVALNRHTVSTAAVAGDLVFIADCGRVLHCLDAATGRTHWTHELRGDIWASPLVADGKVYLGTRRGDFWVLAATREKRVLSTIELGAPLSATATAAHGTLFVATMKRLFAVAQDVRAVR